MSDIREIEDHIEICTPFLQMENAADLTILKIAKSFQKRSPQYKSMNKIIKEINKLKHLLDSDYQETKHNVDFQEYGHVYYPRTD